MADKKQKNPWRACPYGEHFRSESKVKEHLRRTRRVRAHFRRGSCVVNPTGKDQIYDDELVKISSKEFDKLSGGPTPIDLGFKNGNTYDELIRGWTQFWNEVLKPKPPLDANLVKALIATESSFEKDVETKHKNKALRAYGLMQVLGSTFKILQDEGGEIKDHYITVAAKNHKSPTCNLAAGIRWLIHKFELHRKNHPKADWIDAISKYKKLPRSHKAMRKLEQFYISLKNNEKLKEKGVSR